MPNGDETPRVYWRPIVQTGPVQPSDALSLAGGWGWFTQVERLARHEAPSVHPATALPPQWLDRLTQPRAPISGLSWARPRVMGILNVTPDSFSDGGLFYGAEAAAGHAARMAADVDILDVGGESTRPGAAEVAEADEVQRVVPVIRALSGVVSIDTRKASVAKAALDAGAAIVNDVSALQFDPDMAAAVAEAGVPLCLMHAQGTPETMQDNPTYRDVLLDVFDMLERRIEAAVAAGIPRDRLIVDPGIGFGKTLEHNLTLLSRLSVFHGLGCVVLVGASRKRFIGTIGRTGSASERAPGSIAVALAAVGQGVQILRVHDTAETAQALRLWRAVTDGEWSAEGTVW